MCSSDLSESASAFSQLFANRWLWAAVALALVLQVAVVHLGFLNLAFGTAPLSLGQWGVCAAMASGVLWYSELRKLVARHWGPSDAARAAAQPPQQALAARPQD